MKNIKPFLKKEFLQTLRDPRTRFILFVAPIIQLILFGYVTTLDLKKLKLYALLWKNNPEIRRVLSTLESGGDFELAKVGYDYRDMEREFRGGEVQVGVWTHPNGTLILIDGTNAQLAQVGLGYLSGYVHSLSPGSKNLLITRIHFNPELKSAPYMLPGVVALVILVIVGILGAVAMTREKERGTYEMLLMTPLSTFEIILGKIIPYILLGFFDTLVVIFLAHLVFKMPMVGNFLWILPALFLYIWSISALSLWVSSISETQQQSMLTTFLTILPMILLSGLFFPVESMPKFFQYIAQINPLTHFIMLLRGIFLTGASGLVFTESYIVLLIFALLVTFLAARNLKNVIG
jgi:ABC-2 type transport system permease protein